MITAQPYTYSGAIVGVTYYANGKSIANAMKNDAQQWELTRANGARETFATLAAVDATVIAEAHQ